MRTRSRLGAVAAGVLLAASLAACGDDDPQGATTVEETTVAGGEEATTEEETTASEEATTEAMTEESTEDGAAAGAATVMTAESDLGTILVDGEGMTLYMFTNDTQDSGESVCEGDCLVAWPPLEGEPTAGEGVDDSLLGTIERSDGSTQASYNGWPLYYWAQDTAPGDVTGQGVGDVWYVLDPAGEPIGMP
ncbi:hypothetical protein V5H98_16930 [Georgenia sp. M64]|uniref:COG4315 family predicted lipoprotein n=1 Tax=Georgenia sp. M64 TaxID=3120520 RepID=UPI0030DFF178